ncbi:MAG: dihydrolipoamide acetyltransferase family protein [Bdellovibrionales bacterium]|nr:dihydrolipoamide acetyltransferase family protein [Bdellovibrionales bacterium]
MGKSSDKEIKLPELGEGVTEGELVKWLISEGDFIQIDQPVAEVMTDKAAMEVPSPFDGVVESFLVKEGDTIQVGQSFLAMKSSDEEKKVNSSGEKENTKENSELSSGLRSPKNSVSDLPVKSVLKSIPPVKIPDVDSTTGTIENEPMKDSSISILATPFTRRLARELGVTLSHIRGSGLAGRVTKEDVLKQAGVAEEGRQGVSRMASSFSVTGFSIPKEGLQERAPLKGVRKKIAEKMQLSKAVIPHFTLLESADVEQLDEVKNAVKEMLKDRGIKVTYLSFVMKALLQTIKEFPELNAGIDDFSKEIVIKKYYHFGFAVDTSRGLLVPVIKDVDKKSLSEISFEIQTLAEKAREGKISPDDMSGGTITITNIGSLGGEYATPIINTPEVAILGMYRLYVKPCWDGSSFKPKKTMNFSLTCDHRLIDGAVSARVLKSFVHKIENPLSLFI